MAMASALAAILTLILTFTLTVGVPATADAHAADFETQRNRTLSGTKAQVTISPLASTLKLKYALHPAP